MQAIRCAACEAPQGRDWQPGQLCRQCGGAVRIDVRCAACTRWTPAAKFCRHCAAEQVPPEHYGAGRMLVQAGVDGLSLALRVRELDPGQRDAFSSRFATQRAIVERMVDEARVCARFLSHGQPLVDELEDALIGQLPWAMDQASGMRLPAPPPDNDDRATLWHLRKNGTTDATRTLAGLALLRCGDVDANLVEDAWRQVHVPTTAAGEAALALARIAPRVRRRLDRSANEALLAAAIALRERHPQANDAALAHAVAVTAGLQPQQAVAALAAADLEAPLRLALADTDAAVRFGAALLLRDEPTLAGFVDGGDDELAEIALAALGERQSPLLLRRLATLSPGAELDQWLRFLRRPLRRDAFAAVLQCLERAEAPARNRALRLLLDSKWDDVDADDRRALGRWVDASSLSEQEACLLLDWAVDTADSDRPYRAADAVASFADAAARTFATLPFDRLRQLHQLRQFLAVADRDTPRALVRRWLEHDDTVEWILRGIFDLQAQLSRNDDARDHRGVDLFLRLWHEVGPAGRLRLSPILAEVSWMNRSSSSFEALRVALWERFLLHPEERPAIWQATKSFRDWFQEKRDRDPRAATIDDADPAQRFAAYSGYDLLGAPDLLRQLLEQHDRDPRLCAILPVAFTRAGELLQRGEFRHGLWLASSWMAAVVNRFRTDPSDAAWRACAAALADHHDELQQVCASSVSNKPDDDVRGFHEHMATELRLYREVVEREQELIAREQQRAAREAADRQRRDDAARQRADEARQREDEARQRQAQEAAAQQQTAAAAAIAAAQAAARLATHGSHPLDDEVLVPGGKIQTLRAYALLLKAMQQGGDVMALFAQRGMSVQEWTVAAGAWAAVMQSRPEIGMRFAQLLS